MTVANKILDAYDLSFEERDELINLSRDVTLASSMKTSTSDEFWCAQRKEYPKLADHAVRFLLPFSSTYLCEKGFSSMIYVKNKHRNRLQLADDLRLLLSNFESNFHSLIACKQAQGSH